MKPMPALDALLERAVAKGVFGTKMRSVIDAANAKGIAAVVAQQFEVGKQILGARPRSDHRAGGHDLDLRQGGSGGDSSGGDPEASRTMCPPASRSCSS
jgi:hypothetical protein